MKLIPLKEVFNVKYGVNLELNKLELSENGINFVSRTSKNNGVSARVKELPSIKPIPSGVLTVSGGGSVLEAFLQSSKFYSGRDLFYLESIHDLSNSEKLVYCSFIKLNKYRYNYGRQANKTLKEILIPSISDVKNIAKKITIPEKPTDKPVFEKNPILTIDPINWGTFKYKELFSIERGRGARKSEVSSSGKTAFISASEFNNGLTGRTNNIPFHDSKVISVVRNGNSVASAFYHEQKFCSTEDVHIYTPKFKINKFIAMFLCTLIKREKYRFNYGRKWGIARMNKSEIKLPITDSGDPDWQFMENYIKSLPYSSNLIDKSLI